MAGEHILRAIACLCLRRRVILEVPVSRTAAPVEA
jgi:hypothetical protein